MQINSLLAMLEEREIARVVGVPHDEARMSFPLSSNTVADYNEFSEVIGNYFNHHYATCISSGGNFSPSQSTSRAKSIIENEYRRKRGGDIVMAFNEAHDGTNSGMRGILDVISEQLKAESVENYITDVFDRHVAPNSFEAKVEIMRQFIDAFGRHLSSSIRADQPERYANNYVSLIRSYVTSLQNSSSIFRSL